MSAKVFVDTNVLVYSRDRSEPEKHEQALAWMAALWQGRAGRLSWQVLQEYYVTVTRKLDPPRDRADARDDLASLIAWRPHTIGLPTMDRARSVEDRFGLSWWDALIVASAGVAECDYLLTEDLEDEQEVDGVRVINPFTHSPGSVLGA